MRNVKSQPKTVEEAEYVSTPTKKV